LQNAAPLKAYGNEQHFAELLGLCMATADSTSGVFANGHTTSMLLLMVERLEDAAILASMEILWALGEGCYVFKSLHSQLLANGANGRSMLMERLDNVAKCCSIQSLWQ
jgi:hypothetical protein